jgi:NitT/TauT family transport system ATP-binding protein
VTLSQTQVSHGPEAPERGPALRFADVSIAFKVERDGVAGRHVAVRDISFDVPARGFVAVVGPSGCGKSTLLNVSSGLLAPTAGSVEVFGVPVTGVDKGVGYITQDANLLPWMTVLDNVALPLKLAGVGRREREERAHDWIGRVGLGGFDQFYPMQLSGGMQKRCSIARTLVYGPEVILMDEPFGPLDAMTRIVLQQELLGLWERDRKAILFVTHDLAEAIALADTVIVMTQGPGRVKATIPVPLPRPRDVGAIHATPGFAELFGELWELFRPEIASTAKEGR